VNEPYSTIICVQARIDLPVAAWYFYLLCSVCLRRAQANRIQPKQSTAFFRVLCATNAATCGESDSACGGMVRADHFVCGFPARSAGKPHTIEKECTALPKAAKAPTA
jgi:hypothetical protein